MRKRRFPRRPIRPRPGMRTVPGRRPVPPKLVEAHRLYDRGEFKGAAERYFELAEIAAARGIHQAPQLYLRAAEAWLKAGNPEQALVLIKKGVGILVSEGRWAQLKNTGRMIVKRLKEEGQDELAAQVQAWLEEQIPDRIKESEAWRRAGSPGGSGRIKLPATCGQCGGPVHPDEVDWFAGSQPVCSYCGAILESA